MTTTQIDDAPGKRAAAEAAAALVKPGSIIGLGSGSTASLVIEALGRRVRAEGLEIQGVATSGETETLAVGCGISLIELDSVPSLHLVLDGADEVDGQFRMIKGRGGALLREKIVAVAARSRVIVITPEKLVEHLGTTHQVPVEVSPFGVGHTEQALRNLGAVTTLRSDTSDTSKPFVTDGQNRIIDCRFLEIADPEELNARIKAIPGVFETGIFVGLCDVLVIGHPDRVEMRREPPPVDSVST